MNLEARPLRQFVAVAEELHFGRAAQRLHMAQPALSQAIRQLEVQLGVQLFERTSRSVRLTAAGSALLERAPAALEALDEAARAARRAAAGETRQLRVGFLGQTAAGLTTPIVRAFRERHPDVTVELKAFDFVRHVSCIREGLADVAFLRPPYADEDLAGMEVEVIFEEPRAALLSSEHPLASKDELFCDDVVNQRFIEGVSDVSPTWRRFWLMIDERGGREPDLYESRISSAEELLELVASGCGIAVTPLSLGAGLRRDDLRAIPVVDIAPAPLALGWRAGDTSSALADFLEVARAESRALAS